MASSEASTVNEFDRISRNSNQGSTHSRSRRTPKSWIFAVLLFYCASVVTVGLLAGFLPRRTERIKYIGTPTQPAPVTPDPANCIADECNLRLASNITVHTYDLEYRYNSTTDTTVQGRVTIDFTLYEPIVQLIYHGKRLLNLEPPSLIEDNECRMISMRQYIPNDYISLRLTTNGAFKPTRYKLTQRFTVNITDGNVGFYQNIFKDGNETK